MIRFGALLSAPAVHVACLCQGRDSADPFPHAPSPRGHPMPLPCPVGDGPATAPPSKGVQAPLSAPLRQNSDSAGGSGGPLWADPACPRQCWGPTCQDEPSAPSSFIQKSFYFGDSPTADLPGSRVGSAGQGVPGKPQHGLGRPRSGRSAGLPLAGWDESPRRCRP